MPLLIIKIGQNEPNTYDKIKRIRKHGDIVQLMQDDITHPGTKVYKRYFVINVNWDGFANPDEVRDEIGMSWKYRESDKKKTPLPREEWGIYEDEEMEDRSLYSFDFDGYETVEMITSQELVEIGDAKDLKDGNLEYDLTNLNLAHSGRNYEDISPFIINKATEDSI